MSLRDLGARMDAATRREADDLTSRARIMRDAAASIRDAATRVGWIQGGLPTDRIAGHAGGAIDRAAGVASTFERLALDLEDRARTIRNPEATHYLADPPDLIAYLRRTAP